MALTTRSVDERKLAKAAASFISSEGTDIHIGLGGSSQYDDEQGVFVARDFHRSLEELLKQYLPETLNLRFQQDAKRVEELTDILTESQNQYENRQGGFWRSIWHGIGDDGGAMDGWIALIPNEYGFAVVKLGLAVVFKLAERSAEKRQKILSAFIAIRDALYQADPANRSFRSNKEACACADRLTQTIVDSIEGLIVLTSKQRRWRGSWAKLGKQNPTPAPDLEVIIEQLEEARRGFERVLSLIRDNVIESTGIMTQSMLPAIQSTMERAEKQWEKADRNYQHLDEEIHKVFEQIDQIAERENSREAGQIVTRNDLLQVLVEAKREAKREQDEVWMRWLQTRHQRSGILRKDELFQILVDMPYSGDNSSPDLRSMLHQPKEDLQRTLSYRGKLPQMAQDQIQASVLRNTRVLWWLKAPDSDIILVEADANDVVIPKTSGISVFCATFITGIITARPDDVVVQYFCGLHLLPSSPWHGPNGLVRLITMQLMMKLIQMQRADISFIDNWEYRTALEEHDLSSLCDLLYSLIEQFPEDITIFFVLDSVSRFDSPATSAELTLVVECLHAIIDDISIGPTVKVLLTSPTRSKRTLRQLPIFNDASGRLVTLVPNSLTLTPPMSERVMSRHILRNSPSPRPSDQEKSVVEYVQNLYDDYD
ncbi:hypothetical protein BJX76DRAFT_357119 [Aspergillus varians]